MTPVFLQTLFLTATLPFITTSILTQYHPPTSQSLILLSSFSLLALGLFLSALATLNFSLAFLIGLLSTPLSFIHLIPSTQPAITIPVTLVMIVLSPPAVVGLTCLAWGKSVADVLVHAAFGWRVWGTWTQVVIWGVWWPAWFVGMVVFTVSAFGTMDGAEQMKRKKPNEQDTRGVGEEGMSM